jgi:DNA-binding MarR family transcriptional regulator
VPRTASASDVAELFLRVVPQVMRLVAADIRRSGLDIEPLYIHLLRNLSSEGRSLGELAEVLSVSAPTMSKTISTLEARKWVARQRSETDGRVVMVGLTPEGRSTLHKAEEYMVRRIAEALDALSDEERARLSSGLEILGDVFSRVPSGTESARTP